MTTVSASPGSTRRRVPPPCWTKEETIALIKAYRDKWCAVNRGNLRAADWDAVAAAIAESSTADPPKSSTQCRHKIEKLRKRYRTEKQRCLNFPGQFCSSWDLFPLLDSMEIGSVGVKLEQDIDKGYDIGDGFRLKTIGDRNLVTPARYSDIDPELNPYFGLDPNLAYRDRKYRRVDGDSGNYYSDHDLGSGYGVKPVGDKNSVSVAFRGRSDCKFKPNVDFNSDYGYGFSVKMGKPEGDVGAVGSGAGFPVKKLSARSLMTLGFKPKIYEKNDGSAFLAQTPGDRNLMSQGFKPRKYGKISGKSSIIFGDGNDHINHRIERRDGFGKNIIDELISVIPSGFRPKNGCKIDGNSGPGVDSSFLNGHENIEMNGIGGKVKTGVNPVNEVVSSIKLFTEGYVKTEKMKMEMLMEIEKMRMETELKHDHMILEMQQQIVDAFAKVILEKKKNKRMKSEVLSPNIKGNENSQVAVTTDSESIDKISIVKEGGEDGFA